MISFNIMKFITAEMIIIFDMILKEIFGTKIKKIVLEVIKVAIISKTIAEAIINFLKTRLIYSSRCFL